MLHLAETRSINTVRDRKTDADCALSRSNPIPTEGERACIGQVQEEQNRIDLLSDLLAPMSS